MFFVKNKKSSFSCSVFAYDHDGIQKFHSGMYKDHEVISHCWAKLKFWLNVSYPSSMCTFAPSFQYHSVVIQFSIRFPYECDMCRPSLQGGEDEVESWVFLGRFRLGKWKSPRKGSIQVRKGWRGCADNQYDFFESESISSSHPFSMG